MTAREPTECDEKAPCPKGRWVLALTVFTLYLALTYGMADRYPFSTFAMFAQSQPLSSMILVRTDEGKEYEVFDYEEFDCTQASKAHWTNFQGQALSPSAVEETVRAYMRANGVVQAHAKNRPGEVGLKVFRRVWLPTESGSFDLKRTQDVLIETCKAIPAQSSRGWTRFAWHFNR